MELLMGSPRAHIGKMIGLLLALVNGGCFSVDEPACAYLCGDNGSCPPDYVCQGDGYCHKQGQSGVCGFVDAAVQDQSVPDLGGGDLATGELGSIDLASSDAPMVDMSVMCTTHAACGTGMYCDNLAGGQCQSCSATSANFCGTSTTPAGCMQCLGGASSCVAGICVCTSHSQCGMGKYCDNLAGGACQSCSTTNASFCGLGVTPAGCMQCSGSTPSCVGGACVCTSHAQCGVGKYCDNLAGGACQSCSSSNASFCGGGGTAAGCMQCSGSTPSCVGGACVCTSHAQCGTGKYCDNLAGGACQFCSSSNAAFCGGGGTAAGCMQCAGSTPSCVGGACVCTSHAQCGTGKYCDNLAGGACQSCSASNASFCGDGSSAPGCMQCVGGTPDCVGGACVCTSHAECGTGKYCDNLAGGACQTCSPSDPNFCGDGSTPAGCMQCSGGTPNCSGGVCS
jgi:hypothetical protein